MRPLDVPDGTFHLPLASLSFRFSRRTIFSIEYRVSASWILAPADRAGGGERGAGNQGLKTGLKEERELENRQPSRIAESHLITLIPDDRRWCVCILLTRIPVTRPGIPDTN